MAEQAERVVQGPDRHIETEPQKSLVREDINPAQLNQGFEKGNEVKLVVEEKDLAGVKKQRVKHMVIVEAKFEDNKWMYQVKLSGGEAKLHRDMKGNDWFDEGMLEWWP